MPHATQTGDARGDVQATEARQFDELSSQLAETVVDAHYLVSHMNALARRSDFLAREQTEFLASLIDRWARGIGDDLFNGKIFFADAAPLE